MARRYSGPNGVHAAVLSGILSVTLVEAMIAPVGLAPSSLPRNSLFTRSFFDRHSRERFAIGWEGSGSSHESNNDANNSFRVHGDGGLLLGISHGTTDVIRDSLGSY